MAKRRPHPAPPPHPPPSRRRFILLLACILLGAAALRFYYFHEARNLPDYDSPILDALYHDYWARGIAFGQWNPPPGQPDPEINSHPYVRPPLYAWFLAAVYKIFGPSFDPPRLAQFSLGLISALLCGLMARKWFGNLAGLLAAAALSFYWILPYYEAQLVEPSLVIPLLLLWVALTVRAFSAFKPFTFAASGLFLGVIVLSRPNALLLCPAFGVWILASGFLAKRAVGPVAVCALVFGLGTLASVSPVIIRNFKVSGEFAPVTAVGGQNLYLANNPLADGSTGIAPDMRNWSSFHHARFVRDLGLAIGKPVTYSEASNIWTDRAIAYIKENPRRFLELTFHKILLLIGPKEVSVDREDEFERSASPILRALPGNFTWFLSAALASIIILGTTQKAGILRRPEIMVPLISLLVFAGSYVPFTVTGRYRIPLLPLLALLAVASLPVLAIWLRTKSWRPLAASALVLIALLFALSWNYSGYQPSLSRWHLARGLAAAREDNMTLALEKFRSAVAVDPSFASARQKHAMVLHELGRLDEARTEILDSLHYEKNLESLEILGRIESGRKNLLGLKSAFDQLDSVGYPDSNILNTFGIFFAESGDLDSAASAFSRSLELDPTNSNALKNLALARVNTGDSSGALELLRQVSDKDPTDGFIAYSLAKQLAVSGDYAGAIVSLRRAVFSNEPSPEWIGALAWIHATHPQESLRDGKAALELASRAVSIAGPKEPTALVVLAAAQAESGDFDAASQTARQALSMLNSESDEDTRSALKLQLESYSSGKPFRDLNMSSGPKSTP
jgi:Flp pilus assembly protein TadD/4-amino-4-deoxy-L-arabinose transferase-like glycosyltransferase